MVTAEHDLVRLMAPAKPRTRYVTTLRIPASNDAEMARLRLMALLKGLEAAHLVVEVRVSIVGGAR